MRGKRLFAAAVAAALALSLAILPAGAVQSSFGDVTDETTAVNADILRLMGVVSGVGNNRFEPDGTLTRAQFCTMAVTFLQKGDEVPRYSTRTIFSDVKSGHWARGYINLAASISVTDGEGENSAAIPLISGVGDGRFLPDDDITIAEAVTILLRALGYTSKEAGAMWPQGYMDLAVSVGLTEGLDLPAGASISRAQAAQLFVNALSCKAKSGKMYYETIGEVAGDKTIILAVNVETDDGSTLGAIRTTGMDKNSESYLPAYGDGNVAALQGKRGYLVLNNKQEVVTFVPDRSTATTIVLNGDAQAGYVKSRNGRQYTVSSGTTVYTSAADTGKTYLEAYTSLTSGTQITMYSEKGKIVAIYTTGGSAVSTIDSDAVVVLDNATAATFHHLTGGATNFNIVKNRQPIRLNQIKPYDVATYDPLSNTLVISDLRMTAVYTAPVPNLKTPTKITVVGKEMDVLESAWDTIGSLKPGDSVALLFTADGRIAGIVPASADVWSTAIGTFSSGGVSIFLPNGGTLDLPGKVSNASGMTSGGPVVISSARDAFSVSHLPARNAPGAFDVSGLTLGSLTVSPHVRIYEQVRGGATRPVDLGSLTMESIPADKITYHVNSTGTVDYIILDNVTGVAYIYGMMVGGYEPDKNDPENPDKDRYVWYLRNGYQGSLRFSNATTYRGSSGDMVGVILGTDRNGDNMIREVIDLQAIQRVKASDFFESQGEPYVRAGGHTYRVSDNVECYYNRAGNKTAPENWLTGGSGLDRFRSIITYSETFTIHVDTVGQQVRIIQAN